MAEAMRHEVLPLVATALRDCDYGSSEATALASVANEALFQIRIRGMANHSELRRIGERLAAHSISAVALKGTHLGVRLFDAIDGRQTRDIDILVQSRQLEQARGVLRGLGYRPLAAADARLDTHPFHGAPWVRQVPPLETAVELHWGLENPRVARIDYAALWQRTLMRQEDREPLLSLPSEECLLFLALHLVKSTRGRLRLLADIDRLLRREGPGFDWDYAIRLARAWDVSWMLYCALCWTSLLFDTPFPPGAFKKLEPPTWRRVLIEVLAPPHVIVRSPALPRLQAARFRFAYVAMLRPFSRAGAAYLAYLFRDRPWQRQPRHGVVGRLIAVAKRPVRGLCWTVLALASALVDVVRLGYVSSH
ncbi:MAG: nucleotidyltransferase family protein [Chloroflexi bacterium]|nr:nucleotidyltransferase family protein [Chloroflexota bacterium]